MNPDDLKIGDLVMDGDAYKVVTGNGLSPLVTSNTVTISNGISNVGIGTSGLRITPTTEELMDRYSLNRIAVDHKVTAAELLRLQEVAPDYASEIKENISKNLARDIAKKVMFKKKHDKDADVHHFIGRVWVFTDEEMKEFIEEVKNVH